MRRTITRLVSALVAAVGRLDKSLNPQDTIAKLRSHEYELKDSIYIVHILLAAFWLTLMTEPGFPWKLLIPSLFTLLLVPAPPTDSLHRPPAFAEDLVDVTAHQAVTRPRRRHERPASLVDPFADPPAEDPAVLGVVARDHMVNVDLELPTRKVVSA